MSLVNNRIVIGLIAVLVFFAGAFMFLNSKQTEKNEPIDTEESLRTPESNDTLGSIMETKSLKKPELTIDKSKRYSAILKTSEGDITINLFSDKTPITVNNFVYLARNNFYDNTVFHRVIKDFMIQGGDPKGDGTGGPGYVFDDEPFEGEYSRGIVAMANAGENTNGSQFFIMHGDRPLPPAYVIFGEVSKGIEVVDKIAIAETALGAGGELSKPVNVVSISTIEIIEE